MPSPGLFAIKITGLAFSASHFITFGRTRCEPIHGHTFRVEVIWRGKLGRYGYIVDFRRLRSLAGEILSELNDRVLLPVRNPAIDITLDRTQVRVQCGRSTLELPRSACALIDVDNVTAERLAEFIALQVEKRAAEKGLPSPQEVEVWVEEEPGCLAGYRLMGEAGS
ncbi:MAG: 6-carboxytetrahydropterin synthase [Thermoguttaceae bacterium]|nr:6-carboxytetrahydropterin synthase [Thermoguttaceae bacterium]MDW8078296.1 6-carboxytetrahydropterin synthase [Thermoguttaceae bacterium]